LISTELSGRGARVPFSKDQPISQQIEQTANFYQPSVYQLLSFYHALETESEPFDGQFLPLTTVRARSPEDVKVFAVGLIPPPASAGTHRLLDRSASLKALEGPYEKLIAENPDVGSSSRGDLPGETGGVPTSTPVPVGPTQTDDQDFYMQFVAMCNRLGCQPEEMARLIQSESSWRASAVARNKEGQPIAKGLIQFTRSTAYYYGMTQEQYDAFESTSRTDQLQWVEKYYKGRAKGRTAGQLKATVIGGFNNPEPPSGSIYHSEATPPAFKSPEFQRRAYMLNSALDRPIPPSTTKKGYITVDDLTRQVARHAPNAEVLAGIQKAKERLGMGANSPLRPEEEATPDNWVETGRDNANKASQTSAQVANKDLNQTNLGKAFMAAQEATIRLMEAAMDQMARTPPLRLLVNPQSFRVSAEKLISNGNWGRNGPIIEHWGENQDKIEGSGKIAAFYSMDALNANGPGLTRTARQFSVSYQNLLSLFLLYRNNGGVWFPDPLLPANARVKNLSVVGSVYLYYDEILYIGSFDSLNLTESEGAPFTLEYSFSFTVKGWYLLDHLDDPQYTYGRKVTPSLPTGTGGSPLTGGNNPQPSPTVRLPGATVVSENDPLRGILTDETGGDDPLAGLDE